MTLYMYYVCNALGFGPLNLSNEVYPVVNFGTIMSVHTHWNKCVYL